MRPITIKEVAGAAGVSTATISRVLNQSGYVSQEVRKKVLDTIERLNYQPNAIARSLKQERSRAIGIILPDMTNPYFMRLSRSIQRKLLQQGLHCMFMDTYGDHGLEVEALNGLMMMRVEAVVLAGTGHNIKMIQGLIRNSGVPFVLIDRKLPGVTADLVAEENHSAAYEAAAYLALHHRKIGILSGPENISTARERLDGVSAALQAAGISLSDDYRFTGDLSRESGKEGIHYYMRLPEPPTAVFSINNEMTFGLYIGLKELGVPLDQLEVVSFGDLEFSGLFRHKLSIVEQRPEQVGEAAAEIVLKRLKAENKDSRAEIRSFVPRLVHKW